MTTTNNMQSNDYLKENEKPQMPGLHDYVVITSGTKEGLRGYVTGLPPNPGSNRTFLEMQKVSIATDEAGEVTTTCGNIRILRKAQHSRPLRHEEPPEADAGAGLAEPRPAAPQARNLGNLLFDGVEPEAVERARAQLSGMPHVQLLMLAVSRLLPQQSALDVALVQELSARSKLQEGL
jgi:hypothetical protein